MIIIFNDSPSIPNRTIGAYRVATALRRAGHEVEVIDYLSSWRLDILFRYLDSIPNIDWVGFSSKFYPPMQKSKKYLISTISKQDNMYLGIFTKMQMDLENKLLNYIKSRNLKIVVGGPNAELVRHYTSAVDIVCLGYADNGIISIHNYIVQNDTLIFEEFDNTKVVDCDKHYPVNDLTVLDTEYIETDFIQNEEVFPIEIGRGCIFHCAFCEFGHLGKKPGTYIRPKESIKKDIVDRYKRFGSTRFLFVDDTFNDSIEKMNIIREIREETNINFEFWSYCRLDLLAAKSEMVDLIPEIGWTSFTFGVETFNRDSGKSIGKGADPQKLKSFLLELRERFPDIKMQVNIIVGLPHDTDESARETVQWFIDNPHVTQFVKVTPLAIRNPEGRKFASKFSLNPEKYGYTVDNSKKLGNIMWVTKSMNATVAGTLAIELQDLLRDSFKDLSNNKDGITTMHDTEVLVESDNGNLINTLRYRVTNYIASKLRYRNVI